MLLESFNTVDRDQAVAVVRPALDVPRWIDAVVDGRPYGSVADLAAAAQNAAMPFTEAEIDGALVHHPRIGERAAGSSAEATMSRSEQAGVDASSADALADGNRAYEAKFDRVFLVRAAGRSADDILTALRERLEHTPTEELAVIDTQLREIAALRLQGALS